MSSGKEIMNGAPVFLEKPGCSSDDCLGRQNCWRSMRITQERCTVSLQDEGTTQSVTAGYLPCCWLAESIISLKLGTGYRGPLGVTTVTVTQLWQSTVRCHLVVPGKNKSNSAFQRRSTGNNQPFTEQVLYMVSILQGPMRFTLGYKNYSVRGYSARGLIFVKTTFKWQGQTLIRIIYTCNCFLDIGGLRNYQNSVFGAGWA